MPESFLTCLSTNRFCRSFLGNPFLRVNEAVWNRLPASWKMSRIAWRYGGFLNYLVKMRSNRFQVHGTFFMRNRPEIELIRSLAEQRPTAAKLKITVIACSNGAEVYSVLYAIRSARPDLGLEVHAIDISQEIINVAREAVYSPAKTALVGENVFERLTQEEIADMFDEENGRFRIKPWISQGVEWRIGDAFDPELAKQVGRADIVIANKFLCHMKPLQAEACLRNLVNFVKPDGYLFVSGVDLDVRTKVAFDLAWIPVPELMREIHDGDPSVRRDWPLRYWGLEPFDQKKNNWNVRYASAFQLAPHLRHEISGSQDDSAVSFPVYDREVDATR